MAPFFLLLLPPAVLAEQVCFNISDGGIYMSSANIVVNDLRQDAQSCQLSTAFCLFQCTPKTSTPWFHGSSGCMEAETIIEPPMQSLIFSQIIKCTAYPCERPAITQLMNNLTRGGSLLREMEELFYVRNSCEELFGTDQLVRESYLRKEKAIIHCIMEGSQLKKGFEIHKMEYLSLLVVNISDSDLNITNTRIQLQAPKHPYFGDVNAFYLFPDHRYLGSYRSPLLSQNTSFYPPIWLPMNALQHIPEEKRVIGLVSYKDPRQFQLGQEVISSEVIRIELLGQQRLQNLTTPIQMVFRTDELNTTGSVFLCHYLDEDDSRFSWKTDGCETYNETNENQTNIICSCDHATPFTVLLIRGPISEVHWRILSYISYIGCGLSAFFTALSLLIYVFGRSHRLDYSITIHVSLSGALFLLNITFLMTEWGATVELSWVCVLVAALMHYSLLCCFTWMALEALHLYLMLIKVFNTYYKHYLLKLSAAGWGVPGIIVGISVAMKNFKQFYGVKEMTMTDSNQTSAICWITDDSYFYSLNLAYFTLIFVFNSGILVAVASSICKMKPVHKGPSRLGAGGEEKNAWRDPQRFSDSCKAGLTVLGLTCLMGTTWGLAFLGSGYVSYPILYLFCILNSTQGFFIFLWICLSARKQRKREMEDRQSSSTAKTSGIKSE